MLGKHNGWNRVLNIWYFWGTVSKLGARAGGTRRTLNIFVERWQTNSPLNQMKFKLLLLHFLLYIFSLLFLFVGTCKVWRNLGEKKRLLANCGCMCIPYWWDGNCSAETVVGGAAEALVMKSALEDFRQVFSIFRVSFWALSSWFRSCSLAKCCFKAAFCSAVQCFVDKSVYFGIEVWRAVCQPWLPSDFLFFGNSCQHPFLHSR